MAITFPFPTYSIHSILLLDIYIHSILLLICSEGRGVPIQCSPSWCFIHKEADPGPHGEGETHVTERPVGRGTEVGARVSGPPGIFSRCQKKTLLGNAAETVLRKKEFAVSKVWRRESPRPMPWPGGGGEEVKLVPLTRWEGGGQGRAVLKLLSWSSTFCQQDLGPGGTEISTEQRSRAGHGRRDGETEREEACGPILVLSEQSRAGGRPG